MKVNEMMTKDLITVNASSTAIDAAKKMNSEKVGTVLVIDNGRLRGMVTDREISTKVIVPGKYPSKVRVSEFMTKNPITVSPEMEICDVSSIIGEKGYRRIPIVEKEIPVGIISVADIAEHAKTCSACTQNILSEAAKAEKIKILD